MPEPRHINLHRNSIPEVPYPLYDSIPFTWEGLGKNPSQQFNNKIAGEYERIFGVAHEGPVTPLQYFDVDNAKAVERNQNLSRMFQHEMIQEFIWESNFARASKKETSSPVGAIARILRLAGKAKNSINHPLPEDYFERKMLEWPGRFEYHGQVDLPFLPK